MTVADWLRTGPEPALLGSRCETCAAVFFPPVPEESFCRDPRCEGTAFAAVPLSRRGRVWSYTDARYQPPAPFVAAEPYEPFALAAVELPEGLVVLGQVADGFGVDDLQVGTEVDLVVEALADGTPVWRWRPVP